MNKALVLAAILIGGFLLSVLIVGSWAFGVYNQAFTLRNQYEMKVKANEAVFDNMWKKIAQTAQVTDAQKDALKEIFTGYAEARSGGKTGGTFINAVREAIPTVDTTTFRNLQNIITGSRDEWTANQIALVDIAREHNLLLKFPSSIVMGFAGFTKIDPKVITSTRTEQTFKTGKDDDVGLGLGKK
jgi:hypothetical protein